MPEYEYVGVERTGAKKKGRVQVQNEGELRMLLRSMGIRPTSIREVSVLQKDLFSVFGVQNLSVNTQEIIVFIRLLQVMIASGVPLISGLEIMESQSFTNTFKIIIGSIRTKVSEGAFFWESLKSYPNIFSNLVVALIQAGESSGSLDQMLLRVNFYLERADLVKKKVKSAMTYPALILIVGSIVVGLMIVFVIPQVEKLLVSSGGELPGPTKFVLKLSHFVVDHILKILGSIATVVFSIWRYLKTKEGKYILDKVLLVLPGFGPLVQKSSVGRFARTLQTLLSAGVNILDALEICQKSLDNLVIMEAMGKVRTEIESGKTLGATLAKIKIFPDVAVQMVAIGESTGSLDRLLEKLAEFYDTEVNAAVESLTKMIEPIIIAVLGLIVGGLMISLYLPMFKLGGSVG